MIARATWITCLSSLLAACSQDPSFVTPLPSHDIVLAPGGSREVVIELEIAEGYHLQANPVRQDFLIPTTLKIRSTGKILSGDPAYPPGKPFRLEGGSDEDEWLVYDGTVQLKVPLSATEEAKPAQYMLQAEVHFQACDEVRCFSPRSVSFVIPVEVK